MQAQKTYYTCNVCGKEYTAPRYLDAHERRGCKGTKRGFAALLDQTKLLWEARKRRKVGAAEASDIAAELKRAPGADLEIPSSYELESNQDNQDGALPGSSIAVDEATASSNKGKRRSLRKRVPAPTPKPFRQDDLPEPAPAAQACVPPTPPLPTC
ncbi:hypothetical protein DFP72DRAFT_843303 [Ephemerocybe angulata]|uniref:C2H2-type domain-containing protein n=1 Tax=Ephemerocybe angulata TaxID=980116 RepID=A0A8H6I9J9_9AGAR|nr:hypothetical protein DFP72DRAFT_843303 [Tulosesus angulatus]